MTKLVQLLVLSLVLSLASSCATQLQTSRGPVRLERPAVSEKVWNVLDAEYAREVQGRPDASQRLDGMCQRYVSEEREVLRRNEKETALFERYRGLTEADRATTGKAIASEFRAINGNRIEDASSELLMSAHTLISYTIDAMEQWCEEKTGKPWTAE